MTTHFWAEYSGSPSHDMALAIAIVMQEDGCGADHAAWEIRSKASHADVPVFDAAREIVEVGSHRSNAARTARAAVQRGGPFTDDEQALIIEEALGVVMRENGCSAEEAAALIRASATDKVCVVDVSVSIVELSIGAGTPPS